MQTLKSSQNTINCKKCRRIGFVAALLLHAPILTLAIDFDFIPKNQEVAKEIGAMSFALASFAPPPSQAVVEPPVESTIPKIYEPAKKPKDKPPKKHVKKTEKKPDKKHEKKIAEEKQAVKQSQAKVANSNENKQASMQHNTPVTLGSNNQNPFLAEVKRLIDEHNKYPRLARRMGLTGEVVVRMVLSQDGRVMELRVIESSTHAILDSQTLQAIEEASKFFPKPDKAYILHIPIEYQLNKS